jgi:hypothetical protein
MAHDSQRDKARALFGKAFFENTKEKAPAKNGAVALQRRANALPIPTYKVGGVVKKQAGGRMSGRSAEADDVLITTARGQRMLEEQRRREREAAAKAKTGAAAKRAKADTLLGIPAQKEGGRANEDFTGLMKKAASRAAAKGNPVMKDGGATNEYIGKRINARMAAGNYKDGGRAQVRNERKMADIEKDYKIALAKGKNEGIAKAKYEQRKADAADDYAKATKADRSVTRGAEKAAEFALKEARRTKGVSISNRDNAESFMQKNSKSVEPKINVAETLKGLGMMPAAADKVASPARKALARKAPAMRQARPTSIQSLANANKPTGSLAPASRSTVTPPPPQIRTALSAVTQPKKSMLDMSNNPAALKEAKARAADAESRGSVRKSISEFLVGSDESRARYAAQQNAANINMANAGRKKDTYNRGPQKADWSGAMVKNGKVVKRAAGGAAKARKGQMKGC